MHNSDRQKGKEKNGDFCLHYFKLCEHGKDIL